MIPIGLQLQALYQELESAMHAHYMRMEWSCILADIDHKGFLDKYFDVIHSSSLIEAFQDGCIGEDNIALLFSIDGAHGKHGCQFYCGMPGHCEVHGK